METPVCKRAVSKKDAQSGIWCQSPLVFTSPGGNVRTKARIFPSDTSSVKVRKLDDMLVSSPVFAVCDNDENLQARMVCVSIPTAQVFPPRLRSSFSSQQITPLKARNRQDNLLFPFSPSADCQKGPLTTASKLPRSKQASIPVSARKLKPRPSLHKKTGIRNSREISIRRENFMRRQEKLYVSWINLKLQQPVNLRGLKPEIETESKLKQNESSATYKTGTSIRVSKLSLSCGDGHGCLRSLFTFSELRQRLSTCFNSQSQDDIVATIIHVGKRIDEGKLKMKDGCAVLADVGLRKQAVDVLMGYSATWLKKGLYIVLGSSFDNTNEDNGDTFLAAALEKHFFTHSGLSKEYSTNKTFEGLYRQGYHEALGRVILKRLLLLVLVLDKLKCQTVLEEEEGIDGLDGGSELLFRRDAQIKSSRQALQDILRNAMYGEGDLTVHLSALGYRLHHVQGLLAEYNFQSTSFEDLQDGVRLCRLAQCMTSDPSILKKIHLPATSKKRQQQHCEAALESFTRAGVSLIDEEGFTITAECIMDCDRDMIFSLIWKLLLHLELHQLLNREAVLQEVIRIESINANSELQVLLQDCSISLLDLLLRWTKAICRVFGFEVQNFKNSFYDGQAFCYLISYYLPTIVPAETIAKDYTLGIKPSEHNFGILHNITSKLEYMGEVLNSCIIAEEEPRWFERNVILFTGLLCSKLICKNLQDLENALRMQAHVDSRRIEESAVRIQSHYRGWRQAVTYRKARVSAQRIQLAWKGHLARLNFLKQKVAAKIIQKNWQKHVQAKEERHTLLRKIRAVETLQAFTRGYLQRSQYRRMVISAVRIQAAWRRALAVKRFTLIKDSIRKIEQGWKMVLERRSFYALRAAATVIQLHYRRWVHKEMTIAHVQKLQALWRGQLARRQYALLKASVVRIQRRWRHILENRKRNWGAIKLQAYWRGCLVRSSMRKLKQAAVLVQTSCRRYLLRKRAAIRIQTLFRRRLARRKFLQLRNAACLIQKVFKAWLERRRHRTNLASRTIQSFWKKYIYKRKTDAALLLQATYRGWRDRRSYTSLVQKVKFLQALYRRGHLSQNLETSCFTKTEAEIVQFFQSATSDQASKHLESGLPNEKEENRARAATVLQAYWRGFSYRKWRHQNKDETRRNQYSKTWKSTFFFDMWWRKHQQQKLNAAAATIQCLYRAWKCRVMFKHMHRAASLIQAHWKGYAARRGQNEELLDLRLRMQNTAARSDCNMTLGNRLNEALALLLSFRTVSSILHICATIDVATQHSRYCCERIAEGGAIVKIVQLIQTTNRSTPHEQVLKHALSILANLARYPPLAGLILSTPAVLHVAAEQLQMSRNKDIFFRALEIIKLVCKVSPEDVLRTSPLVVRKLQHVRQILERKVEAERKNLEKLALGPSTTRLSAEKKKLAEAKMQLQSLVNVLKLLTGIGKQHTEVSHRSSYQVQTGRSSIRKPAVNQTAGIKHKARVT